MFARNLSDFVTPVVVAGPAAASQSPLAGSLIDTHGFEAVRVLAVLGDVSAGSVLTLRLQGGDAADGSDMADLPGVVTAAVTAGATDLDGKLLSLDVCRLRTRYVRPVLTRTAAPAAVTLLLAELYDPRRQPVPAGDVAAARVVAA